MLSQKVLLGLYCNLFIAINDHCVIRSANISYSLAFSLDDKSLYQGEDVLTRIKKMDCAPNQICDRSNYVSLLQDLCLVQLNTLFLRLLKWSGWCFFSGGLGVMDLSWCYRFFRNKFFLSLLSREVEDETVSSRLCDWFGGEGAEVRPGEEVPE